MQGGPSRESGSARSIPTAVSNPALRFFEILSTLHSARDVDMVLRHQIESGSAAEGERCDSC